MLHLKSLPRAIKMYALRTAAFLPACLVIIAALGGTLPFEEANIWHADIPCGEECCNHFCTPSIDSQQEPSLSGYA